MRKRTGWYDRIEHSKISQEWVRLHCKNVTKRELELLKIVYYRKLLRRDHLEIIHSGYRNLSQRTNVLNRSINKLFSLSCLDKVHEEAEFMKGNFPAILSVDRAGAILINKPYKQRIPTKKRVIGNETIIFREIPNSLIHTNGINKLEVDTILFTEEHGYKFKWRLERDNYKEFFWNKEKIGLKPDVLLILNADNKIYFFFIEYDTGTEDNRHAKNFPTLLHKMENYHKYKSIGQWKSEDWAKKFNAPFPLVLFVTEDEKRIEYIKEKGGKIGLRVDAVLSSNYIEGLASLIKG
jgi:hypothetical protein